MAWRRPCHRWDTHMAGCVSECASSGLPGCCILWSSVCSETLGVQRPQKEGRESAAGGQGERAGGGTSDGGRVLRGSRSSYCSADSGRCAGSHLDWGDLRYVLHPPLPHCCCWTESY